MTNGWRGGSSRQWRRVRAAVLAANPDGRCRVRVAGVCTGRADTVHHTHGRARTGDDPAFLVASCTACNLHIGDPSTHPTTCDACADVTVGPRAGDPRPRPMTRW